MAPAPPFFAGKMVTAKVVCKILSATLEALSVPGMAEALVDAPVTPKPLKHAHSQSMRMAHESPKALTPSSGRKSSFFTLSDANSRMAYLDPKLPLGMTINEDGCVVLLVDESGQASGADVVPGCVVECCSAIDSLEMAVTQSACPCS